MLRVVRFRKPPYIALGGGYVNATYWNELQYVDKNGRAVYFLFSDTEPRLQPTPMTVEEMLSHYRWAWFAKDIEKHSPELPQWLNGACIAPRADFASLGFISSILQPSRSQELPTLAQIADYLRWLSRMRFSYCGSYLIVSKALVKPGRYATVTVGEYDSGEFSFNEKVINEYPFSYMSASR